MHTVLDSDGARPTESRRKIRKQMGKYGDSIEFAEGEVIMVRKAYFENGFQGSQIDEKGGKVCRGRNIVLATGTRDVFPDIKGYAENWPCNLYGFYLSTHRCSTNAGVAANQWYFCDGFECSH